MLLKTYQQKALDALDSFQCAWSLDSLAEVDVWVRNVARHPDSFCLPRVGGRFYPDFVARLNDGRIFVVEYKGGASGWRA